MWSKRNKILLIILVALLALLGVDEITTTHIRNKEFKDILIACDSSKIALVEFYPKNEINKKITLKKINNQWFVLTNDGKKYPADGDAMNDVLSNLTDLRPTQIVGNDKKAWKEYGVTDTSATHIIVKNNKGRLIAKLYFGQLEVEKSKNSYNRRPSIATYVRIKGDKNVYVIPKLLTMLFTDDVNSFRNNNLTPTSPGKLIKVSYNLPNEKFFIVNKNGNWYINNKKADSLNCERYKRDLQMVESHNFAEKKDVEKYKQLGQINLYYSDSSQIAIKFFGDTTYRYVWSSYNPQTYFQMTKILHGRLIKTKDFFEAKANKKHF